ncbi:MAG: hypothetical protein JOY98_12205 [Candidatus Eremiobacteraeota bacterium]|nr:hypothetical protein [Candidatus Eremiobacteraeota bacterium]
MMMRICAAIVTLMALAGALAARCTAADSIVYSFVALRGDVSTCQWFDENLNDRSEHSLVRQVDALYNRVALPPNAAVNVTQTATASTGTALLGFTLGNAQLCAAAGAIRPTPVPSASAEPAP